MMTQNKADTSEPIVKSTHGTSSILWDQSMAMNSLIAQFQLDLFSVLTQKFIYLSSVPHFALHHWIMNPRLYLIPCNEELEIS